MLWPAISLSDLKDLDNVFIDKNYKNCLNEKNYSGFVYFDIGSVLLDLDWDVFFQEFDRLLPSGVKSNHFKVLSVLKEEAILRDWCTGQMGAYDYANSFIDALKLSVELQDKECFISINDIKKADAFVVGAARLKVIELAKKLRNMNFGIGVLSNATSWHEVAIEKKIPVRDIFDVCIFSQDLGCEKPEKKIYEVAQSEACRFVLKKFNATLESKDIYFVDDTPDNVRAAKEMGWNASLVNLLNENILDQISTHNLTDNDLKVASHKRENLIFGHSAALRVEKIFGSIIK